MKNDFFPSSEKEKKTFSTLFMLLDIEIFLAIRFSFSFFSQQGESGKAPREKWILRNICYCSARIETSVGTFWEKFSLRTLTNHRKEAFHSALCGCLCWWKLLCFAGISTESSSNCDSENTGKWYTFRRPVQQYSFLVRNFVFMSRWGEPSFILKYPIWDDLEEKRWG